jgi:hypothetical protein
MMAGHLSNEQLKGYRSHTLGPEGLVAASDHLGACESCRNRLRNDSPYARYLNVEGTDPHWGHDFVYQRMEAYVDDELPSPERSEFEVHLGTCAVCTEEVAELLALRVSLLKDEGAGRERNSLPHIPAWRKHSAGPWAAIAASVVIAVLGFSLIDIPLRRETASLRAQLSSLQKRNEEIRRQADTEIDDLRDRLSRLEGAQIRHGNFAELNDSGTVIRLEGETLTGLDDAPSELRSLAVMAMQTAKAPSLSHQNLKGETSTMMSGSARTRAFSLAKPVGVVIEDQRPLLEWTPAEHAISYTVEIKNLRSRRVFSSGSIPGTHWRPDVALPRGTTFTWEVRARLSDGREVSEPAPPAPAAMFRVVSNADEVALKAAREFKPRSHLLLGLTYAKVGLVDAARDELSALLTENPKSALASHLLESVDKKKSR